MEKKKELQLICGKAPTGMPLWESKVYFTQPHTGLGREGSMQQPFAPEGEDLLWI